MSEKDGGPAFPTLWQPEMRHEESGDVLQHAGLVEPGMSLRDWFAGQALAAVLMRHQSDNPAHFAADAYFIADAMLETRNKKKEA